MARLASQFTAPLAAIIVLLCAGNALAAETVEVAVAKDAAATSVGTQSEPTGSSAVAVTGENRLTNLQKTPISIVVLDIAPMSKRRSQR